MSIFSLFEVNDSQMICLFVFIDVCLQIADNMHSISYLLLQGFITNVFNMILNTPCL